MMKQIYCLLSFALSSTLLFSQQKNTCYVTYQNIKDKSWTFPHWFENEKVTFTSLITYYFIKEFTVKLPNGDQILSDDTVTYRKEYLDQLKSLNTPKDGEIDPISVRDYSSNVVRRHNNLDKKKYLVIDTLVEMDNWQISEDTITILGYSCQKASILYKGKKMFAYFTTKFNFPAGPKSYRGLPGLILMVTNEKGTDGYVATELQYPFNGKIPKLETDVITVSQKEYQILVDKAKAEGFKNLENLMNSLPKKEK